MKLIAEALILMLILTLAGYGLWKLRLMILWAWRKRRRGHIKIPAGVAALAGGENNKTIIFASIMRQKGRKVNGNVCGQVAGHDGI